MSRVFSHSNFATKNSLLMHWAVLPLALVGAVALSFWVISCCWGDDALARWFGAARPADDTDPASLPGGARPPDRPTAELLDALATSDGAVRR